MKRIRTSKIQKYWKQFLWLLLFLFMVGLNVASWQSVRFSDWYTVHIFPWWVNTVGRFQSLFPISVGEMLIVLGILFLAIGALLLLLFAPLHRIQRIRKLTKNWWIMIAWIVNVVLLIQTLNCFILYHGTTFAAQYVTESEHDSQELIPLYNHIVERANELSQEFRRDEKGYLVVDETEFGQEAGAAMEKLGEVYPQLLGYYPDPKPIYFSNLMSQQSLMGMYFPFSMEANINTTMYVLNRPYVMCHELSHLKGYMQEEEANYIAYLACMQSKDPFFQYSGYRNVLNYVARDIQKNLGTSEAITNQLTAVNELVRKDNIFLTKEAWDEVNEKALFDTETVQSTYHKAADTSMKLNGVKDGVESYNRVVDLLLDHYEEKGEFED